MCNTFHKQDFTCKIKWHSQSKGRPRQYSIDLGVSDEANRIKVTTLPTANTRNPHWRIAGFLRDILNEKRDLIYFVQVY